MRFVLNDKTKHQMRLCHREKTAGQIPTFISLCQQLQGEHNNSNSGKRGPRCFKLTHDVMTVPCKHWQGRELLCRTSCTQQGVLLRTEPIAETWCNVCYCRYPQVLSFKIFTFEQFSTYYVL